MATRSDRLREIRRRLETRYEEYDGRRRELETLTGRIDQLVTETDLDLPSSDPIERIRVLARQVVDIGDVDRADGAKQLAFSPRQRGNLHAQTIELCRARLCGRELGGGLRVALTAQRRLDERHQRALTRYYSAAGAGGIALLVGMILLARIGTDAGLSIDEAWRVSSLLTIDPRGHELYPAALALILLFRRRR